MIGIRSALRSNLSSGFRRPSSYRWMSSDLNLKNMNLTVKGDGVAIVTLDMDGVKVNSLNKKLFDDFDQVLKTIESGSDIKSVVIKSGKKNSFIAGADINMLLDCKTAQEAEDLSKLSHDFFFRIEKSKKPVVAAINGDCLGGGLEVALACHYRIATTDPKTKLGLVEALIGLLPGGGGTQRLPALVGIQESLTMMTTGKKVVPAKAKKIGLVDQVCDPFALEHAAIQAAEELASGKRKKTKKAKSLMNKVLEDTPLRSIVFKKAGEMIQKQTKGNYPAMPAILKCVEAGVTGSDGYATEAKEFGKLAMTDVSKNMIKSLFFGTTTLKKNRFGNDYPEVKTLGILGAGLMGAGIAQVTAVKGVRTWMKDRDVAGLNRGQQQIKKNLDVKVKRRAMTAHARDMKLSNVLGFTDNDMEAFARHVKHTDMVVEAVPENLNLKHTVIKSIEEMGLPEHAIFATNTSALPIADIAVASKRPEKVVGMHYFSPVDKMQLLEVIPHEGTSNETMASAVGMGLKQGKTVIVVKDVPGFYVNRCLGPVIIETLALLQDGIEIKRLNDCLTKFGMPVGPASLFDEVGVDVGYHVAEYLSQTMGVRMTGGDLAMMKEMVDTNMLGRKTGGGFFKYKGKKKEINPAALELIKKHSAGRVQHKDLSDEDIGLRLMGRFVNEAALCLQEGIIQNPTDGDVGAVFGIGFPPFSGGPFRYLDTYGVKKFVDKMKGFEDKYGPQFEPCKMLVDLAETNEKIHKD
jgi:enoyl-CoA hydratase/long-chain 3-hydroxyacyl-CoA dehydrogenase